MNGLENIPDDTPALLVYYHGAIPIDIYYLLAKSILFKDRLIHTVGDRFLFKIPGNYKECSSCNELNLSDVEWELLTRGAECPGRERHGCKGSECSHLKSNRVSRISLWKTQKNKYPRSSDCSVERGRGITLDTEILICSHF